MCPSGFAALKKRPPTLLFPDAGAASSLASTPLAASFRALITRSPYLLGGLFNISMFGSVLCLVRLQEHAAAPLPVPPPRKSRQERRQLERDVKSHLRAAGARVWDGKKGE